MYLGELIREYRKKHQISMQTFADRAGLSKAYISQLESNRNPKTGDSIVPSVETFVKVASAMNISVDELYGLVDENQPLIINSTAPELGRGLDDLFETSEQRTDRLVDELAEMVGLGSDDLRRAIDFALEIKGINKSNIESK